MNQSIIPLGEPKHTNTSAILPSVSVFTAVRDIPIGIDNYEFVSGAMFISSGLNKCADFPISPSLFFPDTEAQIILDNAFLSNPGGGGGGSWTFNDEPIPINSKTVLRMTHFNGSGEEQKLIIQLVTKDRRFKLMGGRR